MYSPIVSNTLGTLIDLSRGHKSWLHLRELERSQWWPRDDILELQNQRLKKLISYAYDNVPYYRRIFNEKNLKPEDVKSSFDMMKLPILTKQIIRKNFNHLKASHFPHKDAVFTVTGGSTGEPIEFYTTREEQHDWANAKQMRAERWWGYRFGDKRALLVKRRPFWMLERLRRRIERMRLWGTEEMAEKLPLFAKEIEEFKPEFIIGYPNAIYLLAHFFSKQGQSRVRPKAIVTVGEQLYDFQREFFDQVFNCQTYSHYASWETNQIAADCPRYSGMHIAAESIVVEVADDKGEPVPSGKEGRIIVTNLHNYAMPFIRYDIGDLGVLSDEACPCGRGLPLLSKLSGRTTDFVMTKGGQMIPGMALSFQFLASKGVTQFQFVQERPGEVIINLVLDEEKQKHDNKLADRVMEYYQGELGRDMKIIVNFPSYIPTTKDGKRRLVVSKILDSRSNL